MFRTDRLVASALTCLLLGVAGCSSPNPAYLGDGAAQDGARLRVLSPFALARPAKA